MSKKQKKQYAHATQLGNGIVQKDIKDIFKPYPVPKGVIPEGHDAATVDDSCLNAISDGFYGNFNITNNPLITAWEEGLGFPGYPYLSLLSLRCEYRHITGIRAQEMTRKGITFEYNDKTKVSDEDNKKLETVESAFKEYGIIDLLRRHLINDAFFGVSHIYIDLKTASNDTEEKTAPLFLTAKKINKGDLKGFKLVDPNWVTPVQYNTTDPFDEYFYKPSMWWVLGQQIHASRLITTITEPVPDLLKPAYNFGGVPFAFMCKPYVDNWLRTRQSVSDLIKSFSTMILKTDLSQLLSPGCEELSKRAELMAAYRDNRGLQIVDRESEDLLNVSTPLSSLDRLQAQAQEHLSACSNIPLVKLLGITPSGLNASSDGEIRCFYDKISAMQEKDLRPAIKTILDVLQLHLFGEVDVNINFKFNPLWQLDDLQQADVNFKEAQTLDIGAQNGSLSSQEIKNGYKNLGLKSLEGVDLSSEVIERQGGGNPFDVRGDYE